ncbi:retrovirus-related pol polyprotein from transposon TNT 1-94 [Tanacetum coccineum]
MDGITTRIRVRDSDSALAHECLYVNFFSEIEPKRLIEALNKMDESRVVIKNKSRLVAQGFRQEEGIYYDETFAPVARLEAFKIFLAYAAYMGFMVYQMDMKSAFLNGKISEEEYVQQPPGFESNEFPNHVCRGDKALYGLNQAPKGWYETLLKFIIQHKFVRDSLKKYELADSALVKCPMLPSNNLGPDESEVSVNETVFRGMIRSLMYLIASRPVIQFSTCFCARYQANPKESYLIAVKTIFRYLKGTSNLDLWYPKGLGFDLKAYSDSDYVGCNLDRKSTSRGCKILGGKLVCWSVKKQSSVVMSSAEAEYVATARCCAQVLWIKSQLADYDVLYDKVPIFCDNTSAIAISNNPVLHSRIKHIDIRYHFIKDHILKGDIELYFVPTDLQLADIFTKPLAEPSFTRLVVELAEIPPSEEVSAKDTNDKSLSGTVVHFISKIESKRNKKLKKKKIPSSSKPTASHFIIHQTPATKASESQPADEPEVIADTTRSLEASKSAKDQDNQPQAADTKKAELVDSRLHFIGDVTLESLNKPIDDSPYDTESEIKVIKRFQQLKVTDMDTELNLFKVFESSSIFQDDSNLESMPELSKSKERDADNIVHEMADMNASAAKPTLETLPEPIFKSLKTALPQISKDLKKKLGVSIRKEVHKGIGTIKRKLDYYTTRVDHNSIKIQDMTTLMRDMIPDSTLGEQDDIIEEKDQKDEPPFKRPRFEILEEIPSQNPLRSIMPQIKTPIVINMPLNHDLIPSKHADKGKAIATEEDTIKELMPFLEKGGSAPNLSNLDLFSIYRRQMTVEEVKAQIKDIKRLEILKAEKEEFEKELLKMLNPATVRAWTLKLAEYKSKRSKMIIEYNDCINKRVNPLPITKINYTISKQTKEATMKITRNNDPLTLTVYEKFGQKMLALTEWIEVHTIASKGKSQSNNYLLKSLKENFQWVLTQAGRLGIPSPEDIRVDRMDRNLIPPQEVIGSPRLVITKPEITEAYQEGHSRGRRDGQEAVVCDQS